MLGNIAKKAGESAKDTAIKAARNAAKTTFEASGHIKSQVTGGEPHDIPFMAQVVDAVHKDLTPEEQVNIHNQSKKRLAEIEAELAKVRQQRNVREGEYAKAVQNKLSPQQQAPKTFEEPHSRPKMGMKGAGQKSKKGTKELGKQMSG